MKTSTKIWLVIFFGSLIGSVITAKYLFSAIIITQVGILFDMSTLAWIALAFNVVNIISGNILFFKFLKTRKYNTMLFFSTVPLALIFGALVFVLTGINNYNNQAFTIVKTALNISENNYNNYYWLVIVTIAYLIITFLLFTLLTIPIKKVENATKRLSFGEVKSKIDIGGNKQFMEIESSLNKINENYKTKDDVIKQTTQTYEKFVPKNLIKFLGKKSVLDLEIGSQVKKTATILFCNIHNSAVASKTLSLEQNFKYINSYMNVVSPIIKKYGGFVDKYQEDGLLAVFVDSQSAVLCANNIAKGIAQKNLEKTNPVGLQVGISIHTDEIVFGVIGDENKKSPTIISNSMQVCEKIDDFNKQFGSTFVISKDTLNNLPSNFKLLYRYVGDVFTDSNTIPLFECLDIYQKQKREKLNKYHIQFENGVRAFQNAKFLEAKNIFEKVYREEKNDKVCYVYYNKCCENLGRVSLVMHE